MRQSQSQALFVANSSGNYANRKTIASFAVEARQPGIYPYRELVELGELMSYGVSIPDIFGALLAMSTRS